jgi:hypothetical protein
LAKASELGVTRENRSDKGVVGEGSGDITEKLMRILNRPIRDDRSGCRGVWRGKWKGRREKEAEREAVWWRF